MERATKAVGVTLLLVRARNPEEIERGFGTLRKEGAHALIVNNESLFVWRKEQLAELAVKHRIASISAYRDMAAAGGLISYGENLADTYRRLASYVDRIFKGARPAELPIEQPTTLEFIINLKTAELLGVKIPQSVLQRVDRVIE